MPTFRQKKGFLIVWCKCECSSRKNTNSTCIWQHSATSATVDTPTNNQPCPGTRPHVQLCRTLRSERHYQAQQGWQPDHYLLLHSSWAQCTTTKVEMGYQGTSENQGRSMDGIMRSQISARHNDGPKHRIGYDSRRNVRHLQVCAGGGHVYYTIVYVQLL